METSSNEGMVVEELTGSVALKDRHAYVIRPKESIIDLSSVTVGTIGSTAELWFILDNGPCSVTWPANWVWLDEDESARQPVDGMLTAYAVRLDSKGTIVNHIYTH